MTRGSKSSEIMTVGQRCESAAPPNPQTRTEDQRYGFESQLFPVLPGESGEMASTLWASLANT